MLTDRGERHTRARARTRTRTTPSTQANIALKTYKFGRLIFQPFPFGAVADSR